MSEESHGLFHLGKKDDEPEAAPKEAAPPEAAHHGLFHKEEAPPPPPPEEHHGLFHLGKEEAPPPPPPEKHGLFHLGKEEPPPPPPPPQGLMARLFHSAPVTPEPASPQRPQLFRHHSFRSALYILGLLMLLAGIVNAIPDYRSVIVGLGFALLLGGLLLTGDWHPLSGMLGLRKVRVPTSASGVATVVAEHEAKDVIGKVTKEDGADAQAKASTAQRLAPWNWPWSHHAQEQKAEEAKKFKHIGLGGKVLMGVMAGTMGHGANTVLDQSAPPANLTGFATYAHWAIGVLTIVLILWIITTHIRTFRHHWLSPFGIIRRLIVFLVVSAVVTLGVGLLTSNPTLGQGYGELVGGFVGLLAVLV